LQAL